MVPKGRRRCHGAFGHERMPIPFSSGIEQVHGMFVTVTVTVIAVVVRNVALLIRRIMDKGGFTTTRRRRCRHVILVGGVLVTQCWIMSIEMFDNGRDGRITIGDTIDDRPTLMTTILLWLLSLSPKRERS